MVDNSGTPDQLEPQLEQLWTWINGLPHLPEDFDFTAKRSEPSSA